jgi:hypothetical protein
VLKVDQDHGAALRAVVQLSPLALLIFFALFEPGMWSEFKFTIERTRLNTGQAEIGSPGCKRGSGRKRAAADLYSSGASTSLDMQHGGAIGGSNVLRCLLRWDLLCLLQRSSQYNSTETL